MNVSLSLSGSFGAALEPRDLPVEDALVAGDQPVLLYPAPLPELDPAMPAPVLLPEVAASELPIDEEAEAEPAAEPAQDPVVDPQQWLDMMLSQQTVQLQARDLAVPVSQGLSAERTLTRMAAHTLQEAPASHEAEPAPSASGPARTGNGQVAEGLAMLFERRDLPAPRIVMPVAATSENLALAVTSAAAESLTGSETSAVPAAAAQGAPAGEPVLERGLKLAQPQQARWGEQMLHALRETVEVQVQQRFQQATIRLDPPELGSLEIFISHESGRLSVHISAAQTDIARLLASTSERLRQELVEQNSLQVQVQVSSDSQGHSSREQGRQARDPAIADAVQDARPPADSPAQRDNGVLVTV